MTPAGSAQPLVKPTKKPQSEITVTGTSSGQGTGTASGRALTAAQRRMRDVRQRFGIRLGHASADQVAFLRLNGGLPSKGRRRRSVSIGGGGG